MVSEGIRNSAECGIYDTSGDSEPHVWEAVFLPVGYSMQPAYELARGRELPASQETSLMCSARFQL